MKLFARAAEKIKSSPFIIPIGIVFILMLLSSLSLSYEDYMTSYYGYLSLSTAKAVSWIAFVVALLPQIVQIGASFVFIEDTDKRWAIIFVLIAHSIDLITDIWFKITINGVPHWEYAPLAFIESEGIYTLGSELMLTVSFGMVIKIWPDFWRELIRVITPIWNLVKKIVSGIFYWIFPKSKDEQQKQDNRKPVNVKPINRNESQYHNPDKRRPGRPPKQKPELVEDKSSQFIEETEDEEEIELGFLQRQYVSN